MSQIATELFIVFLLIIANGVFAMSEAAIVAARKVRLQNRAQTGDTRAAAALALANEPNRFLSTVQIGITLIGIFAGAFGGAGLSKFISDSIKANVPTLASYSDSIGLAAVVALIGYFSLIIGELVPKRLALQNPENIASRVAGPMNFISKIASPVVSFLAFSTNSVLKLLGVKDSDEPAVTEEEVKVMVAQGAQSGVFHEAESEMVDRVFRLGDKTVAGLMTRRPNIVWLDVEESWEYNAEIVSASPYSRLPVGRGDSDHLVGVVRAKDILTQIARGEEIDIQKAMQPVVFVPEAMPAFRLMETLRAKRTHMVIVVDEFGATQGLVTLHDILEALVGDMPIVDESDERYTTQRADGSYLCDALMPVDEFQRLFEISTLPIERNVESLSGFVLAYLGRIPVAAETFEAAGLHFEILDMDGQRIDTIGVRKIETKEIESDSKDTK
jgi:putative hemolysin